MKHKENNGHGKVTVEDENGRTGRAEYRSGYLMGGSYVNPSWHIYWDPADDT